jgi:hypothetical protein
MRPSDVSLSSAAAPVPPRCAAHLGSGAFLTRPLVHLLPAARRRFLVGLPLALIARGRARLSQVAGSSSCRVPWSMTPPSALLSCQKRQSRCCLQDSANPWALRNNRFGAVLTRPVPSRTYASPEGIAAPWRKARYRPAGLGFGRTGFAPVGRHSEFHESPHVFIPFRPVVPGRTAERVGIGMGPSTSARRADGPRTSRPVVSPHGGRGPW